MSAVSCAGQLAQCPWPAHEVLEHGERLLALAAGTLEPHDARRFELAEHAQGCTLPDDPRRLILLALLGGERGEGGLVRRAERREEQSCKWRRELLREAQVDSGEDLEA